MRKIFFTIVVTIATITSLFGQEMCQRVFDEKSQTEILLGTCTRGGLLACAFIEDYNIEYPAYQPNDTVVNQLKELIGGLKCVIVLGTWCGDSKEQVPRFFKIIDQTGVQFDQLEIFCVDRTKEAPGMEIKAIYNIEKVPTFIFYQNDNEIGRIIETPKNSLEKNWLEFLTK